MADLKGKSVLITGAAAGIGYQLAVLFASAGCKLILVDIDRQALAKAAEDLDADEIQTYVADVADRRRVREIAAEVVEKYSGPDILINNAGILLHAEMADTSQSDWERLLNVNLWGALNFTYAFLPSMKEKGGGRIVNISSGQIFFRLPTWGAYTAVKSALGAFSEVLGFEMKKYRIKVTTVYPYAVNTGIYKDVEGRTYWARKAMDLMPYYSQSPERAGRIIFKAIIKGKRVSMGGFVNWIGFFIRSCPPLAYLTARLGYRILVKK